MHGYTTSHNTKQSLQNSTTIISNTRVWVLICHPLPDALDLASCVLGKLKVHIQILLSTASVNSNGRHSIKVKAVRQIGCVGCTTACLVFRRCIEGQQQMVYTHRQQVAGAEAWQHASWTCQRKDRGISPQSRLQMQLEPGFCPALHCRTGVPNRPWPPAIQQHPVPNSWSEFWAE